MFRRHIALAFLALATPAAAQGTNGDTVSLTLINRGTAPIKELFVTPAGDANWGRSRLEGKTIAPGAGYTLRRKSGGNCIFDVRVVAGGKPEDHRGINACQNTQLTVGAGNPSFRLVNRGSSPVTEVYATPSGQETFGQNRLDKGPLPVQAIHQFEITPDGNCFYDLKVVFADKTVREKKHTDLCKITELPVQ